MLERHGPASFLFAHDTIVHDAKGAPYAAYVSTWSPRLSVVARVIDHPYWEHERGLSAVVALASERDIRAAAAEVGDRLGHAAHVIFFPVHRVDLFAMVIRAAGTTKGTAVESAGAPSTAAPPPRWSWWATGSTTCRCSRSPAAP